MNIHEFFYNENNRRLYVEFSTDEDGEDFYRILEIPYNEVLFYSPEIIIENDISDLEINSLVEILNEYFQDNDLPEQTNL